MIALAEVFPKGLVNKTLQELFRYVVRFHGAKIDRTGVRWVWIGNYSFEKRIS
jgi:hypothetical protein